MSKIEQIWEELKKEIDEIVTRPITEEDLAEANIFDGSKEAIKFVEHMPAQILAQFMPEFQKKRQIKIGSIKVQDFVIDAQAIYEYIHQNMPETLAYITKRIEKEIRGGDDTLGKIIWEAEDRARNVLSLDKSELIPFDVMTGIIEESVKKRPAIRARRKK